MSYLRLLAVQLRISLATGMQYRVDFLLDAVVEVVYALTALAPLTVVFGARDSVAGWSFAEALLVVGFFTFLQGVIEGAINPSLLAVVEHVRRGTFDFLLLKPKDAQFLVSTARFSPWKSANVLTAAVLLAVGLTRLGRTPSAGGIATAAALLGCSLVILHSLVTLTVSVSFFAVRVDNLTYLFTSVFDAARWPSTVFRGALRFVFTFVLPFGIMTTYPAEALLGRLGTNALPISALVAATLALVARLVWTRSIRHYTSASS